MKPAHFIFSGVKRFIKDIAMMIGFELNIYWLVTWTVVTPIVLCVSASLSL